MDAPEMTDVKTPGNVEEVVAHVKKVKAQGTGISMKAFGVTGVHAVENDEAIDRVDSALKT